MTQLGLILVTYIIAVNVVGFIITASDKRFAIKRMWRVSEKTIFIAVLCGGGPGIFIACLIFRHKIRDMAFMLGVPAFIIIQAAIFTGTVFIINNHVENYGSEYILNHEVTDSDNIGGKADAIIVPGALVFNDGRVSEMLADRLDEAVKLYRKGLSDRILVSGDHGTVEYDEVNSMRKYLLDKGIPAEAIFMDHAGFDTYDSMYRARDIFLVKKAVVVTQHFHLVRALFISRHLGVETWGVESDKYEYPGMAYYKFREYGARLKAYLQAVIFKPLPKFLGEVIPVSGDGRATLD